MKYSAFVHPTEDVLTKCALNNDVELEEHLFVCKECRDFVDDVRTISSDIADLDKIEIPEYLHEKIMAITNKKRKKLFPSFIQNWYKNTFFYGVLTILFVILIYAIFIIFL